jgi:predicted alpha/beta-fold hydrolase
MVNSLSKKYPSTLIISVGFSLGGNLITKYLGEKNVTKPANLIGGISICQGYDATVTRFKFILCTALTYQFSSHTQCNRVFVEVAQLSALLSLHSH